MTTLYNFENGVQGWGWDNFATATAAVSTEQAKDGVQSLKATIPAVPDGGTGPAGPLVKVDTTALWPGTVVTLNAFFPTGTPTTGSLYFQAYSQYNNYNGFDTAGNGTRTITARRLDDLDVYDSQHVPRWAAAPGCPGR